MNCRTCGRPVPLKARGRKLTYCKASHRRQEVDRRIKAATRSLEKAIAELRDLGILDG